MTSPKQTSWAMWKELWPEQHQSIYFVCMKANYGGVGSNYYLSFIF